MIFSQCEYHEEFNNLDDDNLSTKESEKFDSKIFPKSHSSMKKKKKKKRQDDSYIISHANSYKNDDKTGALVV